MRGVLAVILMLTIAAPGPADAQATPDIWKGFAEKVGVGSEVNVRLADGRRFRAVLIGVRDDALLLQPKTRVTVPVQAVSYDAIASLERRQGGGVGAGKAAAIGVASGVGTFLGILAIVFAALED